MLRARAYFRRTSSFVIVSLLIVSLGCVSDEPANQGIPYAVASASGPAAETSSTSSDVPVEALSSLEKVYVPLRSSSMQSLDDALAEKGYGNVVSSDFKPQFEMTSTEFGPAVVAYSTGDWIPPSTVFQPMSLTQWLEAALTAAGAEGVILNPGHPGQALSLPTAEIRKALEWLPRRDALPMELHISLKD